MNAFRRLALPAVAVLVALPVAVRAQYPSAVVRFEEVPINDPANSQELFQIPEWNVTTAMYIVPNPQDSFARNGAFRSDSLLIEGGASMYIYFDWVDPADPNAWLRLSTFDGDIYPNPALHTQGKVRFKIQNRGDIFTLAGNIGIALGIRETGVEVPQLQDGGAVGEIEWVGVTGVVGDGETGRPVPAYVVPAEPVTRLLEFDLATGHVWVGEEPDFNLVDMGGGIFGFTGNGQFDVVPQRGTLEHLVIVNLSDDPAQTMQFAIDELQFESPEPEPVIPPIVRSPIVKDDTEVAVGGFLASADQVTLYRDDVLVQTVAITDPNVDVVFPISPAIETGECFSATQRDSITGNTSSKSDPTCALPAAAAYSFCICLDEDGSNCSPAGPWELVPAESRGVGPTGQLAPHGQIVFPDNTQWQTIDIPLDDPDVVTAWLGGNGSIAPAGTGVYSIDSFWFTSIGGTASATAQTVFLDAIEALDANGNLLMTIHTFEGTTNWLSQIRGQSSTNFTSSALSTLAAYDGAQSHRVTWTYPSTDVDHALGLYHNIGYACGTSPKFPDTTQMIRLRLHIRAPATNTVALPAVASPIVGNQSGIRVFNAAGATAVQLFINGQPAGPAVTPTGTETDFTGLTLSPGDSISANQVVGGQTSDYAYPKVVTAKPLPPTVVAPIAPLSTQVQVTNVANAAFATASLVEVFVNGEFAGSAAPSAGAATVTVSQLLKGDEVQARQRVNSAVSDLSDPVIVSYPAPVIYYAPAAGDTVVRVARVDADADTVKLTVNGTTVFTAPHDPEAPYVDVPVTALTMGQEVVASFFAGAVESQLSSPETVTVGTVTQEIFCDDFEYSSQTTFDAVWSPVATQMILSSDGNTTPGGSKSASAPDSTFRSSAGNFTGVLPTDTNPVVFSINILDTTGGAGYNQYADINNLDPDFFLAEIGISTLSGVQTHYQARLNGNGGINWFDLDDFDGPTRSPGWHNFTMVFKGPPPGATVGHEIDVYVDGLLATKNALLTEDTELREPRIGSGLGTNFGTVPAYFDDYCAYVGPITFPVLPASPPVVRSPVEAGDETVTLTNLAADTTQVTVYADGTPIGSINPAGAATVDVPVTPLEHLDLITATQTSPAGQSVPSAGLEVGIGNGDVLIALGVRETGDLGPLGSPGSGTGAIEWIGATAVVSGAPQGTPVSPLAQWQTLTFDPAGPVEGFTGGANGEIDGTRGTIEHLAFAVNAASADRSSGAYRVFIDNVVNVGAGPGGADFVITNFEGFAQNAETLFQEPGFSGSTDANVVFPPDYSFTTDAYGNPGQSQELGWFWVDTLAQRWLRITTSGVANVPNPIIDLTRPVRLDILIIEECLAFGDLTGDGQVTAADVQAFLDCVSGPDAGGTPACYCADVNGNGDVDLADIAAFQAALGG